MHARVGRALGDALQTASVDAEHDHRGRRRIGVEAALDRGQLRRVVGAAEAGLDLEAFAGRRGLGIEAELTLELVAAVDQEQGDLLGHDLRFPDRYARRRPTRPPIRCGWIIP